MTYLFLAILVAVLAVVIINFKNDEKPEDETSSTLEDSSSSVEPVVPIKSAKEKLREELALREQDYAEIQREMELDRQKREAQLDAETMEELTHLEPKNEFEVATVALHKQECDFKSFLEQHFMKTTFTVITNQRPETNEKGEIVGEVNLFKVKKEDGKEYICLFSSPERALLTRREQTGYDYSIQSSASSLIAQSGGKFGLVINYGWDAEVILSAELATRILAVLKAPKQEGNVRFSYSDETLTDSSLFSVEKSREIIQQLQKKELNVETLKEFAVGDFLKMKFSMLLRKKATRSNGLISFDINDILLVAGPKDRPFLGLFSDPHFIAHAPDEVDALEEIVEITGYEVLRTLPSSCGILINPGTKLFLPLG
jgi:hypothetical protein